MFDIKIYYLLLFIAVLISFFVPLDTLLGQRWWLKVILGGLIISLPLFFAGIIFASSLKKSTSIEIAFGSNLLGAVLGGMLEYSSLAIGLGNLALLALVMYIGSFIALRRL